MNSVFVSSSFVNPEVSFASLDFEVYLNSLVANLLIAVMVFFAFVLFVYISVMAVQYIVFCCNQRNESKPGKQETYGEQTFENIAG